ncbi:hypothetical protein MiTe_03801 [Microcystis aeruginosa NIES-2520]|jgi:hypothetical protein|uniref:Uncharacterized protein n=1 Tax=Microcystis aeruginosa NIES-2520 TaxID=2303982 RepID=A0A5A5RQ50_MICAE|nr:MULTISPECIES: hypothetical protein [Microcystis]MDJ0566939.1 hypothetical protein [Microcystis sp. M49629_WE12]GCA76949.1 hypothetical protein MiTe_03801 [Microcystis aeruginosa NIES-2520]
MVAEIITEVTAITTEPPPQLASVQILELLNQILYFARLQLAFFTQGQ